MSPKELKEKIKWNGNPEMKMREGAGGQSSAGQVWQHHGAGRHPERHGKPLQGLRQWGFGIKHRQVKTCLHHTGRRQAGPTERHLPQYIHVLALPARGLMCHQACWGLRQ